MPIVIMRGVQDGARTVVLIDDEAEIVSLERALLEHDGRFVIVGEGADGTSAVRLARTLQPDAIVLDVLMPRMDGWEALPLIKRVSPYTQVSVPLASESLTKLPARS